MCWVGFFLLSNLFFFSCFLILKLPKTWSDGLFPRRCSSYSSLHPNLLTLWFGKKKKNLHRSTASKQKDVHRNPELQYLADVHLAEPYYIHVHKCPFLIPCLDSEMKKYPQIRLQHAILLGFFLPTGFCSLKLHLYVIISTSTILISFFLCNFIGVSFSQGTWKGELLGERERKHIWSISKDSKMGGDSAGWFLFQLFTAASTLMSGVCVVMIIKYFEGHLWVETHSTGNQACPVLWQNVYWPPNCGSHLSFIIL